MKANIQEYIGGMKASEARQLANRVTGKELTIEKVKAAIKKSAEKGNLELSISYSAFSFDAMQDLRKDGYTVSPYPERDVTIISWD